MSKYLGTFLKFLPAVCISTAALGADADQPFTVAVTAGDFDVMVVESARLDARRSVTLASELPSNQGKLIWLVDEGTYVEEGVLVAKFDRAPFEEELTNINRDLQDGRAALGQAEAELQIQIRSSRESVAQIEHALQAAELKLKNLRRADHPLRLSTAKIEIQSARVALDRASQEHKAQKQMLEEGFGNQNMLDEAAAVEREQRSSLELAEQRLSLSQEVILPGEIQQAEMEISNRQRELENSEQMKLHTLAKLNNSMLRLRNQLEVLENSHARAEEMLTKTEISAPVSGFVVFKNIPVNNERRKVQVGDSVWNRHGFIVIPDMSEMVGHVDIREQDIGKIAAGQAVTLRPEAYPGLVLQGEVDTVGTLAADMNKREENFFHVRIALNEVDPRLRPGMRAQASILASQFRDVLRVPIEAVFYEDDQTVCFVWSDDEIHRQNVEVGTSDGEYVVVTEGLESGQRVLLTYPRQGYAAGDPD